jgi:hypothetical protein
VGGGAVALSLAVEVSAERRSDRHIAHNIRREVILVIKYLPQDSWAVGEPWAHSYRSFIGKSSNYSGNFLAKSMNLVPTISPIAHKLSTYRQSMYLVATFKKSSNLVHTLKVRTLVPTLYVLWGHHHQTKWIGSSPLLDINILLFFYQYNLQFWLFKISTCLFSLLFWSSVSFFEISMSCPLLRLMYGEYWFRLSRLSMIVIGSFASYTKTKSVESA